MIPIDRPSYSLAINPRSGNIARLRAADDPAEVNLAHADERTGFGVFVFTRQDDPPVMGPSGSPVGVESVSLPEYRLFAGVESVEESRIHCRNVTSGHTLRYEFADDHFDLWLDADLPYVDQAGLDLNVAFMDLRQNDPSSQQFTAKCVYRSEDRSLCYVYLERPEGRGMLVCALSPSAAWRLCYRNENHAVTGLQMLARFDSRFSASEPKGPVRYGVRISFHDSLETARAFLADSLKIPLVGAPVAATRVNGTIAFQVNGTPASCELKSPQGVTTKVDSVPANAGLHTGRVTLDEEGFHVLTVYGADGRSSDLTLHAGVTLDEVLRRSTEKLEPYLGGFAEHWYWAQAFLLARQWLGPDARHDGILHAALKLVGMQGVPAGGLPEAPDPALTERYLTRAQPNIDPAYPMLEKVDGWYKYHPIPVTQRYCGRELAPFHIYQWERVQDQFEHIRTFLYASRAYGNDAFYEHAVAIAGSSITDNVDAQGRVYCLHLGGNEAFDYTTVIAPLQALLELLMEMEARQDVRASRVREACLRIAGHLMRRGFEFPTEGVFVHLRWTEDGSITCTALSLLSAYLHLEARPEWLQRAREILAYHEPWRMDVPDARILDSSYRYWETQWENDGEGRALNCGHAWTLWQAEAYYLLSLASGGDALALLRSYNGFRSNLAKFMPDGKVYGCFTPDYLPFRPRKFEPMHSYPDTPDTSLSFYVWPRLADTWRITAAVMDPALVGAQALATDNGCIALQAAASLEGDHLTVIPGEASCRRFFLLDPRVRTLTLHSDADSVELIWPGTALAVLEGTTAPTRHGLAIKPLNGRLKVVQKDR